MSGAVGARGDLDAPAFHRALMLFQQALREHRDEIDSLNVYPVPDGDTGTNMLHTQDAVMSSLVDWKEADPDFEGLGRAVAQASLMGARGNSGVILSQVLRGLCERMPSKGTAAPGQLAEAVQRASEEAWRAVARPAEGTILSVLRDAARSAQGAAGQGADALAVAEATLAGARESLARTREANPDLLRAGVVDAGGKGIVLLFDALRAALAGDGLSEPIGNLGPVGRGQDAAAGLEMPSDQAFEVQYLLDGRDDGIPALRRALGELGDSLVVVGGGGLFNVHVHTNEPQRAVDAGKSTGEVRDVSIVHLAGQVRACLGGQARAVRVAEQASALVAVADGDGLRETFASLGAVVVPGGPGNNPSVQDLVTAIEAAPADEVLVLPNHRNIVPAAERAAAASWKKVVVIPALSIPAGLSAAAAFNPLIGGPANAGSLDEAAAGCRSGEITRAERDAETPAGRVDAGDWLGLVDGKAVAVGRSSAAIAVEVAGRLTDDHSEILTLVVGVRVSEEELREVLDSLREAFVNLEIQTVRGGQPRYPFLIGVE